MVMKTRGGPRPEEVHAQLERILGHRAFEASARTRAFLRFVVEETLAGRGHRLKGYTVAVEVFGRTKDFDANLDPVVRIQAGRLRRALERYYLVAGGDDPVLITVPKGGYVATFARKGRAAPAPAGSVFETVPTLPLGVSVAVLPFKEIPPSAESRFFGEGLTEDLCRELNRYQDLVVIPFRGTTLPADGNEDREPSRTLGARFLLEGSVRRSEPEVKVSARLIDGAEGHHQVWAQGYRRPLNPRSLIGIQEEIARAVATAVGGEYGAISQRLAEKARKVPPANLSTYEAILCFYDYESSLSADLGAQCLAALQAAVRREPEYGPAWSALSTMMRNAYILDLKGFEDPRGRMADYAHKGAGLTPRSQMARGVLAHSHFVLGEREAFLREIEAALSLNPGSPFWVGATGYLLILADEGERGRPLLERAIAMNPCHPGWFNHSLYIDHYIRGEYERAHEETLKVGFSVAYWGPLLRAAVLGQLGREAEAGAAVSELLEMVPDFQSRARDLTHRPILSESIVDGLLDGLRKAGLRLEDG
jgi:TolB-like protein